MGHSLTLEYREEAAVVELSLGQSRSPTFSIPTLIAFEAMLDEICATAQANKDSKYRYFHLISANRQVFSMGGDLPTIARLARDRDLAEALTYGHKAASVIYRLWDNLGLDLITTACV